MWLSGSLLFITPWEEQKKQTPSQEVHGLQRIQARTEPVGPLEKEQEICIT